MSLVPIPWETGPQTQGRRIAQFGDCRYDYASDTAVATAAATTTCDAADSSHPPVIPEYIRRTLLVSGIERDDRRRKYTQCIINSYDADDGIPWHVDHANFGPEVLVYVFGEDRPLLFRRRMHRREEGGERGADDDDAGDDDGATTKAEGEEDVTYVYARALPTHCSMYVLSGPARHIWEHSVDVGKDKRVSITFRSWAGSR
jgi:alkylated DNA repair dioxygenase AlkB